MWLPSFFSAAAQTELGKLVVIDHLLRGTNLDQYAKHLSMQDRETARLLLKNQQSALQHRLMQVVEAAYAVRPEPTPGSLDASYDLSEQHFQSLHPPLALQRPVGANLGEALEKLLDQALTNQYPGHPKFGQEVKPGKDLREVLEMCRQAAREPDGRFYVEEKPLRTKLRNVCNPLDLGQMSETHFVLGGFLEEPLRPPAHSLREVEPDGRRPAALDGRAGGAGPAQGDPEPPDVGVRRPDRPLVRAARRQLHADARRRAGRVGTGGAASAGRAGLGCRRRTGRRTVRSPDLAAAQCLEPRPLGDEGFRERVRLQDRLRKSAGPPATRAEGAECVPGRDRGGRTSPNGRRRAVPDLRPATWKNRPSLVRSIAGAGVETSATAMGRSVKSAEEVLGCLRSTKWELFTGIAGLTDGRRTEAGLLLQDVVSWLTTDESVLPSGLCSKLPDAERRAIALLTPPKPSGGGVPAPAAPGGVSDGPSNSSDGSNGEISLSGGRTGLTADEAGPLLRELLDRLERESSLRLTLKWSLEGREMSSGTLNAQQIRTVLGDRWGTDPDAVAAGLHVARSWGVPESVEFGGEVGRAGILRAETAFEVREALAAAEDGGGRMVIVTDLRETDLGLRRRRPLGPLPTVLRRPLREPAVAVPGEDAGWIRLGSCRRPGPWRLTLRRDGYPPVSAGVLDAGTVWRARLPTRFRHGGA